MCMCACACACVWTSDVLIPGPFRQARLQRSSQARRGQQTTIGTAVVKIAGTGSCSCDSLVQFTPSTTTARTTQQSIPPFLPSFLRSPIFIAVNRFHLPRHESCSGFLTPWNAGQLLPLRATRCFLHFYYFYTRGAPWHRSLPRPRVFIICYTSCSRNFGVIETPCFRWTK